MSTSYRPQYAPTVQEIRDTFAEEILSLGGAVSDVFDDGERLFMRAVLARDTEIRAGDSVNAGVALRAADSEILVHPYTFRQICANGAIAAHALRSHALERVQVSEPYLPTYESAVTRGALRDTIRSCAAEEAFATIAREMRSATEVQADVALQLLAALARTPHDAAAHLAPTIF